MVCGLDVRANKAACQHFDHPVGDFDGRCETRWGGWNVTDERSRLKQHRQWWAGANLRFVTAEELKKWRRDYFLMYFYRKVTLWTPQRGEWPPKELLQSLRRKHGCDNIGVTTVCMLLSTLEGCKERWIHLSFEMLRCFVMLYWISKTVLTWLTLIILI